jgi:molecular chaperone DnaK (HSP70)
MDADGILHVSATELVSGKATSVTIQAQSGLSEKDVSRMAEGRAAARGGGGAVMG